MANITQAVAKISGYLEKKAKLRIGSPWKKYWFVLEGRLLLYYRSKDEYEALSPCKGSINLCPPCNIKPALSSAGVFQIECRASTITLRAENRAEQERWMQALLAAIAQSKANPNRMSHFRYSLDDLPTPVTENKKPEPCLSRQNTMPHRISSLPKKGTKEIIERLQQMGAQTYGGSLGAITKLANRDHHEDKSEFAEKHGSSQDVTAATSSSPEGSKSTDVKNLSPSHSTDKIQNVPYDTEHCSIIQEENSMEVFLDQQLSKEIKTQKVKSLIVDNDQYVAQEDVVLETERRAEQDEVNTTRKSFIVENDQYCQANTKAESEEEYIRNKGTQRIEHLYERISSDSTTSETKESFKIKQNIVNLYERISSSSSNSDVQIRLNEQYSTVVKDKQSEKESSKEKSNRKSDDDYSVPINLKDENTDHNKNTLIIDNEQYIPAADDKTNENPYANGLIYTAEYVEYDAIDKVKEQEALYEDPDRLKRNHSILYQEVEPTLPPRPELKKQDYSEETASQTSSNGENKRKNSRFKKLTQLVKSERKSDPDKPKTKKRSTSFLRRVWRRKAKSLDAEEEVTYDAVDYEFIEKQEKKDKNDVEMLQELQKILEARKNLLQEKLHSNENKADKVESQVQPIVEETEEPPQIRTEETLDEERPSLPPRHSSQSLSPYHDVPQNNKAVMELSTLETKTDIGYTSNENIEVRSIDEILEDLDKEKNIQESRQKVKQLIEKFNEFQGDEDVVLRKKAKSDTPIIPVINIKYTTEDANRESTDELSKLLEELSKVTSAPVMTPGVTTSLVTPVLTDEEWLELIPIRRRRLSEPDYDVPRPHRSLQLQGRTKRVSDNPIPATRFFGPILPPTTNANTITTCPSWSSMDPDSLELLPASAPESRLAPTPLNSSAEKDHSVSSYTSHEYVEKEEVIYAQPKQVVPNVKPTCIDPNIYSNLNLNNNKNLNNQHNNNIHLKKDIEVNIRTIEVNKNFPQILPKSEETFIDSLEPLAEISTAF